jgi:hypothetical protein
VAETKGSCFEAKRENRREVLGIEVKEGDICVYCTMGHEVYHIRRSHLHEHGYKHSMKLNEILATAQML